LGGEQPVLERARAGDPAAFDALFRSHASDVTRVCRRMLDSETAAQDATHEVFLRARRGFASYDPERPFRRWLLGIAGHYCIDTSCGGEAAKPASSTPATSTPATSPTRVHRP
jgi:RNA polymerase sigma-70 factor (ECF subfamily)